MNRALFKLYVLSIKGAFRSLGRKFKTARGALLSIVTLGFFALMFAQLVIMLLVRRHIPFASSERYDGLAGLLPLGMLAYFVMAITTSLGDRAILFSASEVDFLFPAPFTRRQLLAYYLLRGLVAKLGLAILLAVSLASLVPSLLCSSLGILLSMVFLHGATIAAQLIQQTMNAQLMSRTRRIIVSLVLVALGIGLVRTFPASIEGWTQLTEFRNSATVRLVTAPFDVLTRVIVSPQVTHVIPDLAIAIALNVIVYWLVFGLDARYEDIAVRTSQRIYELVQAQRRGNAYSGGATRKEYTRTLLPRFPWWLGVGPNLHRQLLSGGRNLRGMFVLGLITAVICGVVLVLVVRGNPKVVDYLGYLLLGILAYMTFILSSFLPFGFRTDLNHMEVLKALPIRPVSIAAAEVISASIIGCLGQWLLIVVWLATAPSLLLILLAGAAYCIPFNLLLFGSGYLLLLLFPYQLVASGPDVTLMGRTMIMFMGHLFALALGATIAAVPAVGFYLLTASRLGALLVGWCTLIALGIGLMIAVAWAYSRFDVSRDMPD